MKYWKAYTKLVIHNCSNPLLGSVKDLAYWRDNLFASTIIYLLPLCLISLLPGLYLDFTMNFYVLAAVDGLAVSAMLVIAFAPNLKLIVRKFTFICAIFLLSCFLLYYLGIYGPGLLFLLASCIFSILIFPASYSFWPAWLNTGICCSFAVAVFYNVIPWKEKHVSPTTEWIGVSSNLVFLSFVLAALIPRLFNGLQETIDKESQLKDALDKQQNILQEKNNELVQFAYVASHDLKEPLRMVISFMGLLKNKYGGQLDDKANSYIGFAIDGGARMQKMISDLLELSRTTRRAEVKEMVDFNEIWKDVKHNLCKLTEDSHAEIILQAPLPVLPVYRSDVTSLFQNLLANAIKFRKKDTRPRIMINSIEKENEWLFSITDNGIGIENNQLTKIFEIFTRLHSQQSYEGTGIGLSICKKVVEHNGGRIWADSEEDRGSTFFFTIKK